MYAGNVGMSQGLETVLLAAQQISDLEDVQVLIVGNGVAKQRLESRAREMGLGNVRFLPFQPREAVPEMYASADVCLVTLLGDIGNESVPSKAYTIMSSGRPMFGCR